MKNTTNMGGETALFFKLGETGPYQWLGLSVENVDQAGKVTTPDYTVGVGYASKAQMKKINAAQAADSYLNVRLRGGKVVVKTTEPQSLLDYKEWL